MEGGRKREGGREGGREREGERKRERGREGGREREREGERGREEERERGRESITIFQDLSANIYASNVELDLTGKTCPPRNSKTRNVGRFSTLREKHRKTVQISNDGGTSRAHVFM